MRLRRRLTLLWSKLPRRALLYTGSAYLAGEGFFWWVTHHYHGTDALLREPRQNMERAIVFIACVFYGWFRASAFHPQAVTGYLRWLKSTPWTPGMPLPLGPVMLGWPDAIFLAAVIAMAWGSGLPLAAPVAAFLFAFLLPTASRLRQTGRPGEAYLIALGLAGALRMYPWPTAMAALEAALCIVAHVGLVKSFRGYPWEKDAKPAPDPNVFERVAPIPPPEPIALRTSLLGALLFGAWVWSITSFFTPPANSSTPWLFAALFALFAALIRWLVYRNSYSPPLTILGRIVTGRLIIPRYDWVQVAPILTFMTGLVVTPPLVELGCSWQTCLSVSMAVTLATALAVGPSLRRWRLTGEHRIQARVRAPRGKKAAVEAS